MKYKRLLFLFFSFCVVLKFYPDKKNFFSTSPVFLIHTIHSKLTKDDSKSDDVYKFIMHSSSDEIYKDTSYATGSSLDLNIDLLYFSFAFAFPLKLNTKFLNFETKLASHRSIITDLEVGLCYKTFEKKPYNLLFQLGLGFGAVHMNLLGYTIEKMQDIAYTRTDIMMGLGINVLFTYSFTKLLGIYVGLGDMFYFMNIRTYRLVKVGDREFIFEEKLKSENFNLVNTFANSLKFKLGLGFAF